ncbi:hypothetical protein [Pelagicoccus albus]|uniref:Flagellar protein FliL n=1 Tax=Pelagicoccus albus TaxID=415222 RepID=A0A7X1B7W0_9BACT|nr:hypothetical protein [Pelagicoccus albus]MBC2606015.1 hypothetical protein [Pelagicoccus albus]
MRAFRLSFLSVLLLACVGSQVFARAKAVPCQSVESSPQGILIRYAVPIESKPTLSVVFGAILSREDRAPVVCDEDTKAAIDLAVNEVIGRQTLAQMEDSGHLESVREEMESKLREALGGDNRLALDVRRFFIAMTEW